MPSDSTVNSIFNYKKILYLYSEHEIRNITIFVSANAGVTTGKMKMLCEARLRGLHLEVNYTSHLVITLF